MTLNFICNLMFKVHHEIELDDHHKIILVNVIRYA